MLLPSLVIEITLDAIRDIPAYGINATPNRTSLSGESKYVDIISIPSMGSLLKDPDFTNPRPRMAFFINICFFCALHAVSTSL